MTSRDLEKSSEVRDPYIFGRKYLENGSRLRFGSNGTPIGNDMWRIDWSRDRSHHVTVKVKVVTQIYKMPRISKMVGDRDSVTIERL